MSVIDNSGCEAPERFIGCCGAYCRTCSGLAEGACKGCKLGYDSGERDIKKARCPIKVCCFSEKRFETCADCPDFDTCSIISGFFGKKGYKYKKYRDSLEFIRRFGYEKFLKTADGWSGAYGKI